ncbi:N-acetyltransferase [Fulvimarina endophytica]|uniref:N-acetyltransferase n=1 Tax=Fulvimarina endophytica TaxID=2293836 RepID=A0A371X3A9_9HYPH|nr:N-acetyltransferase [Fulvimarina endophytica]RFC63715.1 N-acetyltransferase [Fulvimarina endophytica]
MTAFRTEAGHPADATPSRGPAPVPPLADLVIRREEPGDAADVEALSSEAFGPGRFARAAERVRELHPVVESLCAVAVLPGAIVGSVRLTRLPNDGGLALMLGPLAVRPHLKGRGIGKLLMRNAADAARREGFSAIYLVGDRSYYAPLGYRPVEAGRIVLPRPADPGRVLVLDL